MNQHVTSQQHHMTTTSTGGSQVVKESSYQVQQQQQSYQQQYSSQQPVRMQQHYQVQHHQSSNQGGFGQPGQTQRTVHDSSTVKSQEFVTKGQQPFQRGPQQPQQQNQSFMNQAPANQQHFQRGQQPPQSQSQAFMPQSPAAQQPFQMGYQPQQNQAFTNQSNTNPKYQPFAQQSYPSQPQQFQQGNQSIPHQQLDQSSPMQEQDQIVKKPSKLMQQWPPVQPTQEETRPQFESGGQGLHSWPPKQDLDGIPKVETQPKPLGSHNFGKDSQMFHPEQPMRNGQPSEFHPKSSQPSQAKPQQLQGYPQKQQGPGTPQQQQGYMQKQQGPGTPQGIGSSPMLGSPGRGEKLPQGVGVGSISNIPQGSGIGQSPVAQQAPTTPQGSGFGQEPKKPHGAPFGQGITSPQARGIQRSNVPQSSGLGQGAGYEQGPNVPQSSTYGQGSTRPQGQPISQVQAPKPAPVGSGHQTASQPQQQPEGLQKYEAMTLPRGNINDQKEYFEKPHSYDPTQCNIGEPYGDGNLPEWPPKVAGGPNMTMTYPSAFKLRDEAPIDHQTLPLSAPSQPAFKLTTPIKKKGDDIWPPKGAFGDEPSSDVRDFSKPTKANKEYDSFFAANMLPNNYPGYRAPPGTQHVGYMDDAQPL